MNKVFADHVTNTAFFLSISKKQIMYLQHLRDFPVSVGENHYRHHLSGIGGVLNCPDNYIASYNALEKKGLITITRDDAGKYTRALSEAGRLTCLLLVEAGLMVAEGVEKEKAA